jgi:hypothetical protein
MTLFDHRTFHEDGLIGLGDSLELTGSALTH